MKLNRTPFLSTLNGIIIYMGCHFMHMNNTNLACRELEKLLQSNGIWIVLLLLTFRASFNSIFCVLPNYIIIVLFILFLIHTFCMNFNLSPPLSLWSLFDPYFMFSLFRTKIYLFYHEFSVGSQINNAFKLVQSSITISFQSFLSLLRFVYHSFINCVVYSFWVCVFSFNTSIYHPIYREEKKRSYLCESKFL